MARLLSYRTLADGESAGSVVQPSVARLSSTLLDQRVADIAMEAMGPDAVDAGEDVEHHGEIEGAWRYSRSATIASGTTEIQRLLIARAMTGEG